MEVVILAAGKGSRMFSDKPKVLHSIGGSAMLEHVVRTSRALHPQKIHTVIGFGVQQIKDYFARSNTADLTWVLQAEQLGTGHAVQQALPGINIEDGENQVLVLYGDVPLIQTSTLQELLSQTDGETLALLTVLTENPTGLGRIIRNTAGEVTRIVEERDANSEQKQINEVNSGIMCVPATKLVRWLGEIRNDNDQSEYYLTDLIALAADENCQINAITLADEIEVQGVNDKTQLALLERHYQMNKQQELLDQGVTLRDPERVEVRGELSCGKDCVVDINVIFEGTVSLGNNVVIGANTVIKDAVIEDGAHVLPGTNIDGATIGANSLIGPYARIRPGTVLGANVKIGNFVETKNAILGEGSKANHLAYIGDAEIGRNCNIGAGTIFCNYDGANKHKSTLGDNVFIGSNSVLVAPVVLANNAFVAAGSAVNCDVPADSLAVARSKQRNIPDWKRPTKGQ
ncbi:MAG: UDP-N-acetylglucosamine diphosphorylase/glucosamine-1-phosphate N-acetyltransferase [Gammaproteobacteria bacterium]|jgi:bifunctional UDP-N-acetylglucosamine pyrophosphorylase/glucosamine-1-phosphate N-acetyltransferase|nr:UDP-N-acetylglucosamine diphosphorylase/glucosamine-1-phosphate N-acetyltransferase [Gammaproteobacteria bacterium]